MRTFATYCRYVLHDNLTPRAPNVFTHRHVYPGIIWTARSCGLSQTDWWKESDYTHGWWRSVGMNLAVEFRWRTLTQWECSTNLILCGIRRWERILCQSAIQAGYITGADFSPTHYSTHLKEYRSLLPQHSFCANRKDKQTQFRYD